MDSSATTPREVVPSIKANVNGHFGHWDTEYGKMYMHNNIIASFGAYDPVSNDIKIVIDLAK